MLKLNYKFLVLFLLNLNFRHIAGETDNFRENLIAQWKSENVAGMREKRDTDKSSVASEKENRAAGNPFNSQLSLVVIASEIDENERVNDPVTCLIHCVANAKQLFLVSDNLLLDDEMNGHDQAKMYNRIKHSHDSRPLDLRKETDLDVASNFIGRYKRQSENKELQTVEKLPNNSAIVLLDENSIYAPQVFIQNRPLKIEIDEGETLVINCTVSSIEDATLKWLNNKNETLTELAGLKYGNIDYYFDGIDISQSGLYTCAGQNTHGTTKQVFQITVKPSRLSAQIMPTTTYLEESYTPYKLSCEVPPEFARNTIITWYYNNASALYNRDLTISKDALIIKKLNRNSNGIYSCSARMNKIIKNDYIDIKVEYAPELIGNPKITQNVYVRYDTNFTLSCEVADAVPEPVVIWDITLRHDKSDVRHSLKYSENPDIVFNGFKPTDEGTYTCYGDNPIGKTAIRTFHLFGQASVKPTIKNTDLLPDKSKSKTIVLRKGDAIKFSTCKCENCMPLKAIKWFYNDNEITKVDAKQLLYGESYVGKDKIGLLPLAKTNITKSDEGEYKCYIENEFGSDTFTFDVRVVDFDTENLDEKANATQIKCDLEEDAVYPMAIFKENEDNFLGYDELPQDNKSTIENVTVTVYGQLYECSTYKLEYSKNPGFKLGKTALDTFKLITIIPNITNSNLLDKVVKHPQPDNKICKFTNGENINANIVRSCDASGEELVVISTKESEYPQLNQDVEFYKDIQITSPTNEMLYLCDLFPYSEKMTNKTDYTCTYTSELGFGEKSFLLYRREKPSIDESVKDHIKILPGTKDIISCDGFGNPQPEVYWTAPNGVKIVQIDEHPNKLEFSIVDEENAGNYTCHAENIYGFATKDAYVEIINVPKLDGNKKFMEISADHLTQLVCPILNAKNFTWTRTLENANAQIFPMTFNGNYTCVGINEAGTNEFTYIVRDSIPPMNMVIYVTTPETKVLSDLNSIDSMTTNAGNHLSAQCVVEGATPPPSIRWLKDNVEIATEHVIDIELYEEDGGEYTCSASNDKGEINQSFRIHVTSPPKFRINLPNKVTLPLEYGNNTVLDCNAYGSPMPSFKWFYNGNLLRHEVEEVLSLDNVTASSSGQYRCVVENTIGAIEREFLVTTTDPLPNSPSVPKQIEIMEPQALRIPCSVTYNPSISLFYWIFESHVAIAIDISSITFGLDEKIYFSESNELYATEQQAAQHNRYGILSRSSDGNVTFELVIQQTKFDKESGIYTCYITNRIDTVESSVSVNILARPQSDEETDLVTDVNVPEHTSKMFDCAIKGNPDTDYTWELNGRQIDMQNDHDVRLQFFGRQLYFLNLTQQHSGLLKCTGVNPLGTHTHEFHLNVEGPPKIIHPENNTVDDREVENIVVKENTPIKLRCPHTGNPTPDIKWHLAFKDKFDLLNEISDTLTLDIIPESATIYCALENNLGFWKKQFNLLRKPTLKFTAMHNGQPIHVKLGQYLLLNCSMSGFPTPTIQWLQNGKQLSHDTAIYYVQNSADNDSGQYTCVGSNSLQKIQQDFDVEIVSPKWTIWSEWSQCSVQCGVGTQHRTRRCEMNGQDASNMCEGDAVEVYECVQRACPPTDPESANGIWSDWSQCDLKCHDTINRRYSTRKRKCLDPTLVYCNGKTQDVQRCPVPNCSINGGWGAWIDGPCSVSCGEGVGKRRRYCNKPTPKYNGRRCQGHREEPFKCKKLC